LVCSAASKLGGVKVLIDQLLQVHDERLSVLHALDVTVECVLDRQAHGDDTLWSRHLHLEVRVVRDRHEFGVARPPKDGVVCTPEPHHLEGERFLTEIVWCTEPNRQIDLPEGLDALAWRDAMERRRVGPQLVQPNHHQPQGVRVQDVEAAASVHQHFGELRVADDRIDN
jgi:hypothetical protein